MPFFQGAHGVIINGGDFKEIHGDMTVNNGNNTYVNSFNRKKTTTTGSYNNSSTNWKGPRDHSFNNSGNITTGNNNRSSIGQDGARRQRNEDFDHRRSRSTPIRNPRDTHRAQTYGPQHASMPPMSDDPQDAFHQGQTPSADFDGPQFADFARQDALRYTEVRVQEALRQAGLGASQNGRNQRPQPQSYHPEMGHSAGPRSYNSWDEDESDSDSETADDDYDGRGYPHHASFSPAPSPPGSTPSSRAASPPIPSHPNPPNPSNSFTPAGASSATGDQARQQMPGNPGRKSTNPFRTMAENAGRAPSGYATARHTGGVYNYNSGNHTINEVRDSNNDSSITID